MTVQLSVDLGAPTPVYEQLRSQLAGHIGTGALRPGDPLPTLRALASDLGIAVNTVSRAYAELEAAGLTRSTRRTGTVVVGAARPSVSAEVATAAAAYSRAAIDSGLSDDAAVEVVRHALRVGRNHHIGT